MQVLQLRSSRAVQSLRDAQAHLCGCAMRLRLLLYIELHRNHSDVAACEHAQHGTGHAVFVAHHHVLIGRNVHIDGFAGHNGGGPCNLQQHAPAAHVAGMGRDEPRGGWMKELDGPRREHARAGALIAGAGGRCVGGQEVGVHDVLGSFVVRASATA